VPVTEEAIATLKAMIVSGELAPGARLPPEKELSRQLGVSRNSLREAVKSLEMVRILDVRQGDGTYVTSLEPRLLFEALSFVVDLHSDASVIELLEVRRVLEPYAGGLAAVNVTDEQLAALDRTLRSVDRSTPVEDLVAHDLEFHQLVAEAGGNASLAGLLEALASSTARARVWRGLTQEGAAARTLAEHRAILDALARHDAVGTSELLGAHIGGVEAWLRSAVAVPPGG
jgi:GntR family transcriptional repressor for pyruvate dehydrogenase complex